jgi:hypothetical protein
LIINELVWLPRFEPVRGLSHERAQMWPDRVR